MADFNSSLPVRTENPGDVVVKVGDGTTPAQQLAIDSSGRVISKIQDSSGNNLSSTSGALDVNITNASIAVTATDLDIRDLSAAQDNVAISDGTDTLAINADGSINITDNGGSLTVDATDFDIRDLSHSQDSVKIGDGTDFLAINADGSINVVVSADNPGTEVCNYQTSASLAGGGSVNLDYTVTASTTLFIDKVWASGSGKIKVEVKVESGVGSGTYNTKFVGFNSSSDPNVDIPVERLLSQVAGAKVRLTITNRDLLAQDVYTTLIGSEVA